MLAIFAFDFDESMYTLVNVIQTVISDSREDDLDNESGIPRLDRSRKGSVFYYDNRAADFLSVKGMAIEKGHSFVFRDEPGRDETINSQYYWKAELSLVGVNKTTFKFENIATITYGYNYIWGFVNPITFQVSFPFHNINYINDLNKSK